MIGQLALRSSIDELIENNKFPAFSIIFGTEGSGKHTLCEYIAKKMGVEIVYFDNKVEDIRNFIETSYSQTREIIYVLQDIDDVSIATKNSLLKITEEPVRNSHVIVLSINKAQLPATLLSRAISFEMQPYSKTELISWVKENNLKVNNIDDCLKICSNIGELKRAININVADMLNYSNKIIQNMKQATISNALSITNKLVNEYDVGLFINALQYNLLNNSLTDKSSLDKLILVNEKILDVKNLLTLKTANKKMLVDDFVLKTYLILNGV